MLLQGVSSAASAANAPEVKVLNNQRQQQEAVIGRLLEGVAQSTPKSAGPSGQRLNIIA